MHCTAPGAACCSDARSGSTRRIRWTASAHSRKNTTASRGRCSGRRTRRRRSRRRPHTWQRSWNSCRKRALPRFTPPWRPPPHRPPRDILEIVHEFRGIGCFIIGLLKLVSPIETHIGGRRAIVKCSIDIGWPNLLLAGRAPHVPPHADADDAQREGHNDDPHQRTGLFLFVFWSWSGGAGARCLFGFGFGFGFG